MIVVSIFECGGSSAMSSQSGQANKPMRQVMPQVATWIDDLREAFGADAIEHGIKRGMAGEADQFHAVEDGHELGTPFTGQCK